MKSNIEILIHVTNKITALNEEYTHALKMKLSTEEAKEAREDYLKKLDLRIKELKSIQDFIFGEDK